MSTRPRSKDQGHRSLLRGALAALVLAAVITLVYGKTRFFEFVFDDEGYILGNPLLAGGWSWDGAARTFTTYSMGNWHPLTSLSHMLDVQIFGLHAGTHHLTNVVLHWFVSVSLFLWLRALTGAVWRSAAVATLFAVHPVQVETVAWVSERKNLLGALFFVGGCGLYASLARRPSRVKRLALLAVFTLGLMSKAMNVTFPLVLMLLDWWPLGALGTPRPKGRALLRLGLEKLPLFALSALASVVAVAAQRSAGALQLFDVYPLPVRIANAADSTLGYVGTLLYPLGLAVFYPHPGTGLSWWRAGLALAGILAISVAVLRATRRPYLAAGWLWYLAAILPVIGIVQAGGQARADRYLYVPSIGLLTAAVWFGRSLMVRSGQRAAAALALAAATTLLASVSCLQAGYWRDSATLYAHALEVTNGNWLMLYNLGKIKLRNGDAAGAAPLFEEAIRIRPDYDSPYLALADAREKLGRASEAEILLRGLVVRQPQSARANLALGELVARAGREAEAKRYLRRAVHLAPDTAPARVSLAGLLAVTGQAAEAQILLEEALHADPSSVLAHRDLGILLARIGRLDAALVHQQAAARLAPDSANIRYNLALTLENLGRLSEAEAQYRQALALEPTYALARAGLERVSRR